MKSAFYSLALVAFYAAFLLFVAGILGCGRSKAQDVSDPDDAVRVLVEAAKAEGKVPALTVDYPLEESVFPPDIVAPTVLWHDPTKAEEWLIDVSFEGLPDHIVARTKGARKKREIDPEVVTKANVYRESEYQAATKGWTPDDATWQCIKRDSTGRNATITIRGFAAGRIVSEGSVTVRTSSDPVGAPVFYRDVPLMPAETLSGVVKPLPDGALPLVKWRLRDISKSESRIVMEGLPTCANCHSLSRDGRALSMDMDGPQGDKGAHFVKDVAAKMRIEAEDIFTWNRFKGEDGDARVSFGMFPRISPEGRYVVATVHESVYVQNYKDYRYLQTFYPTRGTLAFFDRETREIKALPGADDPDYVQTNAVWSPDGKRLVFARAKAVDPYRAGVRATFANDPNETQIRYDLYLIPFNEGKGGRPAPLKGASQNGMSNSFPKFSPDGKWIVYVQARNGLLMRPDSRLFMIPAEGGEAREMRCNAEGMNSWHSWSPNGRWLVFSSKRNTPYTQMFLTHVDAEGLDSPAILVPDSTVANRAVNLPEFANVLEGGLAEISTPAVDYRRLLDAGEELERKGRLDEAEAELRKSLALKDDYANTWYALGIVYADRGNNDEALKYYRKAIEIESRHHRAWNNMGVALNRMSRQEEAFKCFVHSLEIHPDYDSAHTNIGNAFFRRGAFDKAVEHYRKALESDPSAFRAHNNLGAALREQGKLDQAIAEFRKAIEINPEYDTARRNLDEALKANAGR